MIPAQQLSGLELDDRFRLAEQIGEGGMGVVYEAEDLTLPRQVAIKLLPAADAGVDLKRRFRQEMDAAASIEHRSIVPIFAAGFDQGFLYIAMRLVHGPDLAQLLESGPLELQRALGLFGDVAGALQCMHAAGYVHRDVKPANVLIAEAGTAGEYALLTDMGIVRALDDPSGVTQGRPPGTLVYMAPETFERWQAEASADQYALACVLYQMLAGRPPFNADDSAEIERLHVSEPAPNLAEFAPEAPDEVCDAVARALKKDPAERFASVTEFTAAVLGQSEAEAAEEAEEGAGDPELPERRLTPASVSANLFGVSPDRDERASQLAMETLLTLWANNYRAPDDGPASPKRRNGALRSLALGENFLQGFEDSAAQGLTIEQMGERLASGHDFGGSDGMSLAQAALSALVDDRTLQGSAGATLMLPFHESLLWYDGRQSGAARPWAIRKVNMRGTGVTLGRMLLAPPASVAEEARADAATAVDGIRTALQAPSPFSALADRLQAAAPDSLESRDLEPDESAAWEAAERTALSRLSERVARHCAAITRREHVAPSSKLMEIRSMLALDLAHHALERSWEAVNAPREQRFILLTYTPEERRRNRVRIASESSYQAARQSIAQAMIATLAESASDLAGQFDEMDWDVQFERRSGLDAVAVELSSAQERADFMRLAGLAFEESRGAGYNRPVDAFRVLLESIELLSGTGQYRYLRAEPDLLAALAGGVGGTPMPTGDFLKRLWEEWRIVIGEAEMAGTALSDAVDGSLLARNARFMEQLMVDAGLAVALSDQTCMVGQRIEDAG